MSKILLVLALVVGVFWWLRSRAAARKNPTKSAAAPSQAPRAPAQALPMVACAHCGLNLPAADAAYDVAGRPYCGDAHRLAGPRP